MSSVTDTRPDPHEGPAAQRHQVKLPPITRPATHPLLSVRETAERLGCSEMTIRRRIAARQFPAVKNGRKSMIPRSFVERLLAMAEAGRTVVVGEAVDEWRAQSGQGPTAGGLTTDSGASALGSLVAFGVFLLIGSLALRTSLLAGLLVIGVMVIATVLGFVLVAVGREREFNRRAAAAFHPVMKAVVAPSGDAGEVSR